jgi:hypothetical protein
MAIASVDGDINESRRIMVFVIRYRASAAIVVEIGC